MLKYDQGLPVRKFGVKSTLLFVTLPCKLITPMSTVVLNPGGVLNDGPDWAALRGSDYVLVSAQDITVEQGTTLWRIENGTTVEGGYEQAPESFPWSQFLLGGAVGAIVGHQATKTKGGQSG